MRLKIGNTLLRLALVATLLMPSISMANSKSNYRIGSGDTLSISIALKGSIRDLSKLSLYLPIQIVGESVYSSVQVTVAPDGTISIPGLAKPVYTKGLTLSQLESKLASKLKFRKGRSSVSVSLKQGNSTSYFIWGEVKKPGRFAFERQTSVLEALSYAGGPTYRANMKKVLWLSSSREPVVLDLSYKNLKKKGSPLVLLKPTDTLVVPTKWSYDSKIWFLILAAIGTAATVAIATDDD